jgi:hypothetical protein
MGGTLLYKCRQCGVTSRATHVPNALKALICILHDTPFPEEWGPLKPGMLSIHTCGEGLIGVADLTAVREDNPK